MKQVFGDLGFGALGFRVWTAVAECNMLLLPSIAGCVHFVFLL